MNPCMNIAHRGASGHAPENTMAAFELAVKMGADAFEVDVQLTKDNELVIMHDLTVGRTSGSAGSIRDMTYEELLQIDFSGTFKGEYAADKCRIARLSEVLELAKGNGIFLNAEIKDQTSYYGQTSFLAAQMIQQYDYCEHSLIASFNHSAVVHAKKDFPNIRIALALMTRFQCLPAYAKGCDANYLQPSAMAVDEAFVEMAHSNGFKVNVWTVDDEESMKKILKLGVDGLMTNYPDRLKKVLATL